MQVTKCDRCGDQPIDSVREEWQAVDRNADDIAQHNVLFSVRSLPGVRIDLCKTCFWALVNEAIEAIKEPVS